MYLCLKVDFWIPILLFSLSLLENKIRPTILLGRVTPPFPIGQYFTVVICSYVCYALRVSKISVYAFPASLCRGFLGLLMCSWVLATVQVFSCLTHILMNTDGLGVFHLFPSVCVFDVDTSKDTLKGIECMHPVLSRALGFLCHS